ncbi:hypothetical protein [Lewinella cohaerens]|uniref:hypothetical protein n=1 Tax=Lewinella cohaerens TaxID=70995 RepID=UPI00036416B4|nr:hypothetical protein [Lewinella cohaerens]
MNNNFKSKNQKTLSGLHLQKRGENASVGLLIAVEYAKGSRLNKNSGKEINII